MSACGVLLTIVDNNCMRSAFEFSVIIVDCVDRVTEWRLERPFVHAR
jgi:hypothetical protein